MKIKKYNNGSYSYYSQKAKRHLNIYSELAKDIIKLKEQKVDLLEACKEAKTIIYNLDNGLEKRSGTELQAIFDNVILKAE